MHAPADITALPAGFFGAATSLVLGIGNCGRQDDGLGWAYLDAVEAALGARCAAVQLRRTYQLNLEDADLIHHYRRVLFVDATKDPVVTSFSMTRPQPRMDLTFTSHAISVPAILATAQQCFDTIPEAYLLAIRGYDFELREGLTDAARRNLADALHATWGTAVR